MALPEKEKKKVDCSGAVEGEDFVVAAWWNARSGVDVRNVDFVSCGRLRTASRSSGDCRRAMVKDIVLINSMWFR